MKQCSLCKNNKSKNEFHKATSKPDGLQTWCKSYINESQKRSRKDNPAKHSEWRKRHYSKDPIKSRARSLVAANKWRDNNKELAKAKQREYAKANSEKLKAYRFANRKKRSDHRKAYYEMYPEKLKAHKLDIKLKKYNISKSQYEALLLKQNFECAICKCSQHDMDKSLAIDHNHSTGKVRGLLCYSCNVGIGHFRDSIELILNVLKYLQES